MNRSLLTIVRIRPTDCASLQHFRHVEYVTEFFSGFIDIKLLKKQSYIGAVQP